jgi:hypothetical protein
MIQCGDTAHLSAHQSRHRAPHRAIPHTRINGDVATATGMRTTVVVATHRASFGVCTRSRIPNFIIGTIYAEYCTNCKKYAYLEVDIASIVAHDLWIDVPFRPERIGCIAAK